MKHSFFTLNLCQTLQNMPSSILSSISLTSRKLQIEHQNLSLIFMLSLGKKLCFNIVTLGIYITNDIQCCGYKWPMIMSCLLNVLWWFWSIGAFSVLHSTREREKITSEAGISRIGLVSTVERRESQNGRPTIQILRHWTVESRLKDKPALSVSELVSMISYSE